MNFLVFSDQTTASAAEAQITTRGRELFLANGFQVDSANNVIGKRASDGNLMTNAQPTTRWDVPRQRLDGKWVVSDPANAPEANDPISPGVTVRDYVLQDITTPTIETYSTSWFPPPSDTQ